MTYYPGIGAGLATLVGMRENPREPVVACDASGCGMKMVVRPTRGGMPVWLLDGKAPKGWKRWPQPEDAPAKHTCPRCTVDIKRGVDMSLGRGKP